MPSIILAVLATAVTVAIISWVLFRRRVAPIKAIASAARGISAGNFGQRMSPRPPGELGALADAFNEMADSLENAIAEEGEERARLAAVLDSSIDAMIAVDGAGRVTFANRAAERLLSRSLGDLVGNPFVWFLPEAGVVDALKLSTERGHRAEGFLDRGSRGYFQYRTAPLSGGWAAFIALHDLTEVRRVEQVRRDFIANVSHELRTPLASIKSVIETLQDGALEDQAVAQEFLARANDEIDRLTQMVSELLELSRIESGQAPLERQPVDVRALVERAFERLRPQAEQKGLRLSARTEGDLPSIVGDADRLERALVNLLHNAIKFTDEGGSVDVSAAADGERLLVRVSDTGVGIDPEDLPRVFERFYKADRARGAAGTGLGLAVVKHTVEAHGGTVSVESAPGKGSTFSLSLPVSRQE